MKKVKLNNFPLVSFTGKIEFPDGGSLYVKFGTEQLQCESFVVEVEGEEGEPVTDSDVIAALQVFAGEVEDVMLARLGALCEKARAKVESKRGRGLGPRPTSNL